MYYLALILVLPMIAISVVTYRWLYRRVSKKDRVHQTKKALILLLISFVMLALANYISFQVLNAGTSQSFWLYFIIYFLFLSVIAAYSYMVIKAANTHKNITKLTITIITLLIYVPAMWWCYQVFSNGVYGGKFAISQKRAVKAAEVFVNQRINHVTKSVKSGGEYWLVSEALKTRDSKSEVVVDFRVNKRDGEVIKDRTGSVVNMIVIKPKGDPQDEVELMLFADMAEPGAKEAKWSAVDYSISDTSGKVELFLPEGKYANFHLLARDCSFSCQNYYFQFNEPIKSNYEIVLDPMQFGIKTL